jgi:hypothetical protein
MKPNLTPRWIFFLGLTLASGCATSRVSSPTAKVPKSMAIETLNRTQYEVLGRTSGQGSAHFIGLWPLPIWWVETDDKGFVFWGGRPAVHARHIAQQRAIESFVKADDLLEPTERVHRRFNPWDARVQVTVSGKAISIKTDKECAATAGNCWESWKQGAKE